jgi:outer membrane receptor protein involved in Fe transport
MGFRINDRSSIMVNGFVTKIDGLVRYIQEGLFYTAQNATNEIVAGGELDAVIGVTDALSVRVGAGFAQTVDSRILDDVAVYSSLAGIAQPYPMFQVHLLPELRLAGGEVIITPEVSWVSQRPSSRSNAQVAGEQYMLPSYALTSLAIAAPGLRTFGDREMAVSLRVSNVFDSEISVPGFGGIDYPEMGRTIWLSIQQDFL